MQERRDILLAALRQHMPAGVRWTEPMGGFFVWLTLAEPINAGGLQREAIKRGIDILSGEPFFAEGGGEHHMRLPFSFLSRPELARGVQVLAEVIRRAL